MDGNMNDCDHVAVSGAGWTLCRRCGTTCERDGANGMIVYYVRGTRDQPPRDYAPNAGTVNPLAVLRAQTTQ